MYRISVSKYKGNMAYEEIFRFKVENMGELQNDMQVLRLVRHHCSIGYSVTVDPDGVDENKAFISYRSHEGMPFKRILFKGGGFTFETTEIPWEQL